MSLPDQLTDFLARNQNGWGLSLLALSAFIEYVFPPFPGDLITVFGAFLVARRGWNAMSVFVAVTLGSAIGCLVDYYIGVLLSKTEDRWTRGRLGRFRSDIDLLTARFRRHGALYIAINRFIPSLRGLFFLAAGMARLQVWKVLLFGVISAVAWNALLLGVGLTAGESWDRLKALFHAYNLVVGAALTAALLVLAIRWWRRRRRG